MKRTVLVTSILVLFLIPAFVVAANSDKFVAAKPTVNADNEVVVPLEVTNSEKLVAIDIPLEYSEGATLDRVEFTERVEYFDFKHANIDNENNRVVIGLISMVAHEKPDLDAGSGPIANMIFTVEDGVDEIEIKAIELKNPDHSLMYYWNDYSSGRPEVRTIQPEFETLHLPVNPTVVPKAFALKQNSPNPFNPVTRVSFDLPKASDVRVSVFNVLGQHVKDLVDEYKEAGSYEVIWDGTDNYGASVASGIYFYRIKTSEFSDTKKMLLLK
jgi:hypothetical protein